MLRQKKEEKDTAIDFSVEPPLQTTSDKQEQNQNASNRYDNDGLVTEPTFLNEPAIISSSATIANN